MRIVIEPGPLNTRPIQDAIDACFLAGGGEVCLAAGEHHTGAIRLRSRVTLHLLKDARLIGSRRMEDYLVAQRDAIEPIPPEEISEQGWIPPAQRGKGSKGSFHNTPCSRWNAALIKLIRAKDAAIIGEEGSVIDGSDPYDEQGEEYYRGPHGINAFYCEDLRFSGYTIQNTGNWAHAVFHCRNLLFDGVTALAGHDGIHMTDCINADIANCAFYTGDDCVAGFSNLNVAVRDCELNTACSAFRFGGTNLYVEGCRIFGPARHVFRGSLTKEEKRAGAHPPKDSAHRYNMLSVFTYYADFSFPIPLEPGNLVIRKCRVENVDRFLHYNYSGNETWQKNRPLSSIRFEDIDATGISLPLTAYGEAEHPLRLEIRGSSIAFAPNRDVPLMHLAYCDRVDLTDVTVTRQGTSPWILCWSEGISLRAENVNVPLSLTRADGPFVCKAI